MSEYLNVDNHGVEFYDGTVLYAGGYGKRYDLTGAKGSYVGIIKDDAIEVTIPISSLWDFQSITIDSFKGIMSTLDGKIVDTFNMIPVNMKSWYSNTHAIGGTGATITLKIPARTVNAGKFKAYTKGTGTYTTLKNDDLIFLHLSELKFHIY